MACGETWVSQRMAAISKPIGRGIDILAEKLAHDLKSELPATYALIHRLQSRHDMNVSFYIASILYFADDSEWKKKC